MRLDTVEFQRENALSPVETGVIVNEGDGPLIDMDGKVVPGPLWHYRCTHDQVTTVTERDHAANREAKR